MSPSTKLVLVFAWLCYMPRTVNSKGFFNWVEQPLNLVRPFVIPRQDDTTAHPTVCSNGDEYVLEMDPKEGLTEDLNTQSQLVVADVYKSDDDDDASQPQPARPEDPFVQAPDTLPGGNHSNEVYYDKDRDDSEAEVSSPGTPIVYRFYAGKSTLSSRTTRHSATAIPFLCIGPNVDHWKPIAQELSSRGFNVIACERVFDDKSRREQQHSMNASWALDNTRIIKKLLDALRWNHVVIVGCDAEALLAIQTAMRLAPHRVVGMILCGNLDVATKQVAAEEDLNAEQQRLLTTAPFALDSFLSEKLKCPFRIICDGERAAPPWVMMSMPPSSARAVQHDTKRYKLDKNRCHIVGGGSAPHRRRPEQFAWVLSRFVEEKVAPLNATAHHACETPQARGGQQQHSWTKDDASRQHWANKEMSQKDGLASLTEKLLSPFSFTVGGRLFASTIFYFIMIKVAIYQFENFRIGVNTVASIRSRISKGVVSILCLAKSAQPDGGTKVNVTDQHVTPTTTDREGETEHTIHDHDEECPSDETCADENADGEIYQPTFFLDNVVA
ncbi:hypothetical protein MPSEU_000470000 [Mayamaea pseudoterrestris]|nr:hypothetical protein MPSEU_000470000 [Mayamaea pseudoterrestris]